MLFTPSCSWLNRACYSKPWKILTYACVMFSHIQSTTTTTAAVITAPGIFAFAFWTLAGQLVFAFIHIWETAKRKRLKSASQSTLSHKQQKMTYCLWFIKKQVHSYPRWKSTSVKLIKCMEIYKMRREKYFLKSSKKKPKLLSYLLMARFNEWIPQTFWTGRNHKQYIKCVSIKLEYRILHLFI